MFVLPMYAIKWMDFIIISLTEEGLRANIASRAYKNREKCDFFWRGGALFKIMLFHQTASLTKTTCFTVLVIALTQERRGFVFSNVGIVPVRFSPSFLRNLFSSCGHSVITSLSKMLSVTVLQTSRRLSHSMKKMFAQFCSGWYDSRNVTCPPVHAISRLLCRM